MKLNAEIKRTTNNYIYICDSLELVCLKIIPVMKLCTSLFSLPSEEEVSHEPIYSCGPGVSELVSVPQSLHGMKLIKTLQGCVLICSNALSPPQLCAKRSVPLLPVSHPVPVQTPRAMTCAALRLLGWRTVRGWHRTKLEEVEPYSPDSRKGTVPSLQAIYVF